MNLNSLIRKEVRRLCPYKARHIHCRVKLDANESPYSYPQLLQKALEVHTNRYPDPEGRELKRAAARRWRVGMRNILLSNGSDEILYYLVTTFGGPVLFPAPTFSMYGIVTQALGQKALSVPLQQDFDIDIRRTIRAIRTHRPKIIFLSIPNNPTGNSFSMEKVLKVVEETRGIVVIDEAYQPFSSRNHIMLVREYPRVVVMRTLSKIGFAALRVGFLIGHPEVVEMVNRVRLPFNVNTLSQTVATEVFNNYEIILEDVKRIKEQREYLYARMSSIRGIQVYPSDANFILFRVRGARAVYRRLLREGILVRDMTQELEDCLRVTVGTEEENRMFVEVLERIMK